MTLDVPWRAFATPQPDRDYLMLLSHLPLRRFRHIPRFFRFTSRIQRQLASTPGVIGYSLRAQPFRREFWTLSVWESEDALRSFVRTAPHVQIMAAMRDLMDKTKFIRWHAPGSEVPPKWSAAMEHYQAEHART